MRGPRPIVTSLSVKKCPSLALMDELLGDIDENHTLEQDERLSAAGLETVSSSPCVVDGLLQVLWEFLEPVISRLSIGSEDANNTLCQLQILMRIN